MSREKGTKSNKKLIHRHPHIYNKKNKVIIIDYAHSKDAYENLLSKLPLSNKKVVIVYGCGGDRDKDKRPIMGKISSDLSSKVIFTSDNPRSEDPKSIINDMVQGVSNFNSNKISIELEDSQILNS